MFRRLRSEDDRTQPHITPPATQPTATPPIETVLGAGSNFSGALQVKSGARIDGTFEGTIEVVGPLVIGEQAKIVAEIKAGAVSVGGSVKGNITADKVAILSTGRIYGDLLTDSFTTDEGGFLRGQVQMREPQAVDESGAGDDGGRPADSPEAAE